MQPSLSLVIAVYNKPEHLRLIFAACRLQSIRDFEIIVADDGSGVEIARIISEARNQTNAPIQHLWHEDLGWRKNVMLNNAVIAAQSPYMVFIDGDCIPHRRFLEDHFNEREPKKVLCGRRVEMSARWTQKIDVPRVESGAYERIGLRGMWDGVTGKALRVEDGIRLGSASLRSFLHRKERGLLGSNFSIHKTDLETVNGFDEEYTGPGFGEDTDLEYRLGLAGVACKQLRHLAIQFHMHHPPTVVSTDSHKRYQDVRGRDTSWCDNGLQKSGGNGLDPSQRNQGRMIPQLEIRALLP